MFGLLKNSWLSNKSVCKTLQNKKAAMIFALQFLNWFLKVVTKKLLFFEKIVGYW